MLTKDKDATIAEHFEDKRSYIALDGRHVLYGRDWIARKYMVWCRGNRKCEVKGCNGTIEDIHHKVKRSEERDDRMSNLEGLCRKHHIEKHPEKQLQWSGKQSG